MIVTKRFLYKVVVGRSHEFSSKRVAIIGGGVAGLQVCRTLKEAGHVCTVYERNNDIGGVWRDNYYKMSVQVPRELYQFPDFEMKAVPAKSLATCQEVQTNIKDFCKDMTLTENILLNTLVKKIKRPNNNPKGWDLSYTTSTGDEKTATYDYVVVSTGMYSSYLNMPKFDGQGDFLASGGEILVKSFEFTVTSAVLYTCQSNIYIYIYVLYILNIIY